MAATLALSVAWITTARAESEPEPIALDYSAPAGCPDGPAFFHQLSGRTARARAARPGENARVLTVAIAPSAGGFTGRLAFADADARSSVRELQGATCAELVEALGLVAALAVDPRASSVLPREEPTPPAPPSAPPNAPAPAATNAKSPDAVAPDLASRSRWFSVGLQAEGTGLAGFVFAGGIFGQLELGERTKLFTPTLRLALARSLEVDRQPSIGRATLQWTYGTLDGCPLRVAFADAVVFRPCAAFSAGVLDASSTGVNGARGRARPWLAASVHGRLVWEPIANVAFELDVGALVPLHRETFFFEPGVSVYKSPVIALVGRAGASVVFP